MSADADYVATIHTKIDTDIATERDRASAEEAELATDLLNLTTEVNSIKDGYDFTGAITAPVVANSIPFYYPDRTQFPDAADIHGSVAHSHEDGAMYFAHGGSWHKLIHEGASVEDLTGTEEYVLLSALKTIAADATDFDEFKTLIAAL